MMPVRRRSSGPDAQAPGQPRPVAAGGPEREMFHPRVRRRQRRGHRTARREEPRGSGEAAASTPPRSRWSFAGEGRTGRDLMFKVRVANEAAGHNLDEPHGTCGRSGSSGRQIRGRDRPAQRSARREGTVDPTR